MDVSGKNDCLQEVFLPQHRLIQGNQQLSERLHYTHETQKRSIINTSVCSDPIRGVPELGLHPLPPMCGSCSRRRAICVPDVFKVSRRQAITRSRMQDHDSPPSGTVSPSSRMSLAKFDVGSQRCITGHLSRGRPEDRVGLVLGFAQLGRAQTSRGGALCDILTASKPAPD
ncbi:hypothetical protein M0657_011862 [Pyricularia oryzae]|nr:hypothetical protein M0657_011862 [Pyricularia oryzae]KAI7909526.1 hypothetical protein M9X92_011585 [Pyricularia oryzae]